MGSNPIANRFAPPPPASTRDIWMSAAGRSQDERAFSWCQIARVDQNMSSPGVEPGLSRPQRDVLTTRR
jgi:hypothetical protein